MNISFDETAHKYAVDNIPVPSVTQVIKEILGVGWESDEWYLQRGRAIHACADMIFKGKEFKADERIAGEVAALRKFKKEINPEVFGSEIKVGSHLYFYAGMLDLFCKIGRDLAFLDWKKSFEINRVGCQLGGYSQAYKETYGKEVNRGHGVLLNDNGTYKMSEPIDLRRSRPEFLEQRTAYKIKQRCGSLTTLQKEA